MLSPTVSADASPVAGVEGPVLLPIDRLAQLNASCRQLPTYAVSPGGGLIAYYHELFFRRFSDVVRVARLDLLLKLV
jgi:hypothetical protein